jgi:Tfp pilus assembly protein PilN
MNPKRLNLLPPEWQPKPLSLGGSLPALRKHLPLTAGLLGGLSVGGLIWNAYQHSDPGALRQNIQQTQLLQTQLSADVQTRSAEQEARRAQLIDERNQLEKMLKMLSQPQQASVPVSEVLLRLSTRVPESVQITKLSYANNTLTIAGIAQQAQAVTVFVQELDRSHDFRNTTFAYTQRENQGKTKKEENTRYSFEVSTVPVPSLARSTVP